MKFACPECGTALEYGDELYIKDGEVIGCDWCLDKTRADALIKSVECCGEEDYICPECGMTMSAGEKIYVSGETVVGCGYCVEHGALDKFAYIEQEEGVW